MVELLSPAGSREALEAAVYFGADAVYDAGKAYGMRAFANNFSVDEIKQAAAYMHSLSKRLYITINTIFRDSDFNGLEGYMEELRDAQVDAFIVSDPGVLCTARRVAPGMPLHLSTQANTTNAQSASFWHNEGVSRVVLARELSLEEISFMRKHTPETLEFEAFVHGPMCISY
jgi:putative protease